LIETVVGYFEMKVVSSGVKQFVGIGWSSSEFDYKRLMPGWEDWSGLAGFSWGWHSDDGKVFHDSSIGDSWGPRYTTGDIVGTGINFKVWFSFYFVVLSFLLSLIELEREKIYLSSLSLNVFSLPLTLSFFQTREIFFTKNGEFLGVAFRRERVRNDVPLCPTVGLASTSSVLSLNFGTEPFLFAFEVPMVRWVKLKCDLLTPTPIPTLTNETTTTLTPTLEPITTVGEDEESLDVDLGGDWRTHLVVGEREGGGGGGNRLVSIWSGCRDYALVCDLEREATRKVEYKSPIPIPTERSYSFAFSFTALVGLHHIFALESLASTKTTRKNEEKEEKEEDRVQTDRLSFFILDLRDFSWSIQSVDLGELDLPSSPTFRFSSNTIPVVNNNLHFLNATPPFFLSVLFHDEQEEQEVQEERDKQERSTSREEAQTQKEGRRRGPELKVNILQLRGLNKSPLSSCFTVFRETSLAYFGGFQLGINGNHSLEDTASQSNNNVYIFDTLSNSWSQPSVSGPPPRSRTDAFICSIGRNEAGEDGLCVFGGFNGWRYNDDFEILSFLTDQSNSSLGGGRGGGGDPLVRALGDSSYSDLLLHIRDKQGKERSLEVNAIVLYCRSLEFRNLLEIHIMARGEGKGKQKMELTVGGEEVVSCELLVDLIGYLYSDTVNLQQDPSLYREYLQLCKKYAGEHFERIAQLLLLTRNDSLSLMAPQFSLVNFTDSKTPTALLSDVQFQIQEEEEEGRRGLTVFHAHKSILCTRSDYFHAMCMGGLAESRQSRIILHQDDTLNPQTFLGLTLTHSLSILFSYAFLSFFLFFCFFCFCLFLVILKYLYQLQLSEEDVVGMEDYIVDVLVLSRRYGISSLSRHLELIVITNLTPENLPSLHQLASSLGLPTLLRSTTKLLGLEHSPYSSSSSPLPPSESTTRDQQMNAANP
jgi:hypothetical protein